MQGQEKKWEEKIRTEKKEQSNIKEDKNGRNEENKWKEKIRQEQKNEKRREE